MGRYERNAPAISAEEQRLLATKRLFVAGCGGLGGYVIELLGRLGVGYITVADGDVFDASNLNRQLLSTAETLGRPKPECARERMMSVNPEITVTSVCEFITEKNADAIIAGHDAAIDALDNGPARILLARACRRAGIPLVSGAISGWRGRVIVLGPDDDADFLWGGSPGEPRGNLCCTAACIASVQAAEAVKVLLNCPGQIKNRLLEINLLDGEWDEIPLKFR